MHQEHGIRPVVVFHASSAHPASDNRILHKECSALAAHGYDVHLAAIAETDGCVNGVQIHAVPRVRGRLARAILGSYYVSRHLRSASPDVLHIHDPELIPLALVWRLVTRRLFIYDSHEDLRKQVMGKDYLPLWSRSTVGLLARILELFAARFSSLVVAATPSIARNFSQHSVVTIENFPWLGMFEQSSDPTTQTAGNFVHVGVLNAERGGRQILDAMAEPHNPRVTLTLAGDISAELKHSIEGDTSGATRMLGILPLEQVVSLISDSVAGLVLFLPLPNHLESQPTKLFEYMAAGKPFIASDFPYWRAMLGEYDCGLFVDPMDVVAISAAIQSLVEQPAWAVAMGERGREAFEARFTFETQATKLCDAVDMLVRT